MKYLHIVLCLLLLGMIGCRSYQIPQAASDHPAHPDAAAAPLMDTAQTLDVDEDQLPHMPPEMKSKMKMGMH